MSTEEKSFVAGDKNNSNSQSSQAGMPKPICCTRQPDTIKNTVPAVRNGTAKANKNSPDRSAATLAESSGS